MQFSSKKTHLSEFRRWPFLSTQMTSYRFSWAPSWLLHFLKAGMRQSFEGITKQLVVMAMLLRSSHLSECVLQVALTSIFLLIYETYMGQQLLAKVDPWKHQHGISRLTQMTWLASRKSRWMWNLRSKKVSNSNWIWAVIFFGNNILRKQYTWACLVVRKNMGRTTKTKFGVLL